MPYHQHPAKSFALILIGGFAWLFFATTNVSSAQPLSIEAFKAPVGVPLVPYSFRIRAKGGARPYKFYIHSGALPPGMKLRSNGRLVGSPFIDNDSRILEVAVKDRNGKKARNRFGLLVSTFGLLNLPFTVSSERVFQDQNCLTKIHLHLTANLGPSVELYAPTVEKPSSLSDYAWLSWDGHSESFNLEKVFEPDESVDLFIHDCGSTHLIIRVTCSSFFSECV